MMEPENNPYTPPSAPVGEVLPEEVGTAARPTSVSVICIIGFIGAALTLPLLFSVPSGAIGAWFRPYLAVSSLIGLACFVGMWRMKKLGAYAYAGFFALNQIFMLSLGIWNISALLIPGVVTFFALKHVSKMR